MMTTDTKADQRTLETALSPAEANAFARVCRYGDKMLGYGILMCISAIAVGFGIQLVWWPLIVVGAVLVCLFGLVFLDAKNQAVAASAQSDALAFMMTQHGGDAGGKEILVTVPEATDPDNAGSQAA